MAEQRASKEAPQQGIEVMISLFLFHFSLFPPLCSAGCLAVLGSESDIPPGPEHAETYRPIAGIVVELKVIEAEARGHGLGVRLVIVTVFAIS